MSGPKRLKDRTRVASPVLMNSFIPLFPFLPLGWDAMPDRCRGSLSGARAMARAPLRDPRQPSGIASQPSGRKGKRGMKEFIKTGLATLVLSLSLLGPLIAEPLQEGAAAYGRGDYATAVRLLRPLAEQGDPYAQANLGLMYAKGQGVPQDIAQAADWYRKAAEQGNAFAEGSLG